MKARLYVVGSGIPTPTPERFGSSLVLRVDDEYLMFDCGPATTYKMVRMGLFPTQIDHLFFTHHHYDHNADYPCFLLCRWDHERSNVAKLKVYGPPPTGLITERLVGPEGAFEPDWRARVEHPASREVYVRRGGRDPRPAPEFEVHEIDRGAFVSTAHCRVTVAEAIHLQPLLTCLSYRIEWPAGSLVVTGDTGRSPEVDRLARGAQTMVINCWDHQAAMSGTLAAGFTGTLDAAEMARDAEIQTLVISHQGPNLCLPGSRERAVADMAGIFKSAIIFAEEFMILDL
jgi:ribonuclease Z